MTTPAPEPAPTDPTPSAPDVQAQHDAAVDAELRDLASQIAAMTKLPYDPTVIRKAIVTAVNDASTPPTVSLNISGDTQTLVSQVRLLNNYTPIVGNTVLLAKQGAEIFILGQIATTQPYTVGATGDGWIRATVAAGSHGGNSNGDIYYRRVLDHGSWKMQWRGGWNVSGTVLISSGVLPPEYRPSSKRTCIAAREIQTGGTTIQFDFNTDGGVNMVGGQVASLNALTTGSNINTGTTTGVGTSYEDSVHHHSAGTGADGYTGWNATDHTHVVNGHWHDLNNHTHTSQVYVNPPGWVSLNGVEYFL